MNDFITGHPGTSAWLMAGLLSIIGLLVGYILTQVFRRLGSVEKKLDGFVASQSACKESLPERFVNLKQYQEDHSYLLRRQNELRDIHLKDYIRREELQALMAPMAVKLEDMSERLKSIENYFGSMMSYFKTLNPTAREIK